MDQPVTTKPTDDTKHHNHDDNNNTSNTTKLFSSSSTTTTTAKAKIAKLYVPCCCSTTNQWSSCFFSFDCFSRTFVSSLGPLLVFLLGLVASGVVFLPFHHSSIRFFCVVRIQRAASQLVAEQDVWAPYQIVDRPAQLVVRHSYDPATQTWRSEQTIVKMEPQPFTHGAMRHCFRLKKRSTPPQSCSNHRFHSHGWSRSSNYVAKAYVVQQQQGVNDKNKNKNNSTLVVDCSEAAKAAVQNDIILQYEAMHWATKFNNLHPPRTIVFLQAYAMEFVQWHPRPAWFAVERFISGRDEYGAGFVKHNTNSGMVDALERRRTPQVFSAFSFYASQGHRLVADIQGVADLYTDPQVHSSDLQFGEGDLGFRGMALFFKSFRHCSYSDFLGVPQFPLSRNELKFQAKYHDDDLTLSDDEDEDEDEFNEEEENEEDARLAKDFKKLMRIDKNRERRRSLLLSSNSTPAHVFDKHVNAMDEATAKRSNLSLPPWIPNNEEDGSNKDEAQDWQASIRQSMRNLYSNSTATKAAAAPPSPTKHKFRRTQSDVDEVTSSLLRATRDVVFDHRMFHRHASGELRQRTTEIHTQDFRQDLQPAPPMIPTAETKAHLGKVHYHLACLHGLNRFPEMAQVIQTTTNPDDNNDDKTHQTQEAEGGPDASSIVFHLCHAAALRCPAACLALGRVRAGLSSCVSSTLQTVVPVDFDSAKELLQRAMEQQDPQQAASTSTTMTTTATSKSALIPSQQGLDVKARAAAACLLLQILQHETETTTPVTMQNLMEETLELVQQAHAQDQELKLHMERLHQQQPSTENEEAPADSSASSSSPPALQVGDRAEGNYCMEGTFYPGTVTAIHEETGVVQVTIQYDDDGSEEILASDAVRPLLSSLVKAAIAATTSRRSQYAQQQQQQQGGGTVTPGYMDELQALGLINEDENCLMDLHTLQADLAHLKAQLGYPQEAAQLYEAAAEGALTAGKMKTASEYSLRAAELLAEDTKNENNRNE